MTETDIDWCCIANGLRRDLIQRRILSGFEALDAHAAALDSIDAEEPGAAELVWRVAQWVDIGWGDAEVVQRMIARFPHESRSRLPLRSYAFLRMAEGMVAMASEYPDEAIRHFNTVLIFESDLNDPELLAIANYWTARCQRKKGEYDRALAHCVAGQKLAFAAGLVRMGAVMRVLESWLCFQKGKHKEALRIIGETEEILRDTDDSVVLGNIQSTYGRIYRQEGRYDQAVQHFEAAIAEYRRLDERHPNLARTLANLAYVKRLIGIALRRKIEAGKARRGASEDRGVYREQFGRLCDESFAHLDEAAEIYTVHPNHRGTGTVHLNRALLHLDVGALDLAEVEGANAFALGEEKDDAILMARARIVQCMVENARLEEGIGDDPRRHAQAALDYIRDAIEIARGTENRRLLARVHTWYGLTLSNEFFDAHEEAAQALNTASGYLSHGFHDTAWDDLRTLKARLTKAGTVDETLRAWSSGSTGDRTFRQITDDFAAFLIPKIWLAENRKIARVAARLAISPKKVRRTLIRAGVLNSATKKAGAN